MQLNNLNIFTYQNMNTTFTSKMSKENANRAFEEDKKQRTERGHFYWCPDYSVCEPEPKKYQKIDEFLSRSAMPTLKNMFWLKKQGITDIIDLRLPADKQIIDEEYVANGLGINYHSLPIKVWNVKKEQLDCFVDLINKTKKENGKCHIHCEEGVDRTGMCTFIYKTLNNISTPEENIQQWFEAGHDYTSWSSLIPDTILYCMDCEK